MIKITGTRAVFSRLKAKVEENFDAMYREKILIRFEWLVRHSPQWSGDYTSNWQLTSSASGNVYQRWGNKVDSYHDQEPLSRGDYAAVDAAIQRARTKKLSFKNYVYLTNTTPLKFTNSPPLVFGDGEFRRVRPENLINGDVATLSLLRQVFST